MALVPFGGAFLCSSKPDDIITFFLFTQCWSCLRNGKNVTAKKYQWCGWCNVGIIIPNHLQQPPKLWKLNLWANYNRFKAVLVGGFGHLLAAENAVNTTLTPKKNTDAFLFVAQQAALHCNAGCFSKWIVSLSQAFESVHVNSLLVQHSLSFNTVLIFNNSWWQYLAF